ncbi:interleukin-10 receptor subunit beta-like isoform X2 [Channa argus]|uniref:interleukin-10 receptor subunit beta-like isoform X2 n=1 Tax=Channa argus TaxID=215402 RepID=UPI003520691A
MSAICAFILTFSTLCASRVVSGVLSGPTKVHFTSYNMNLVLRWDPPHGAASGLLYTAEYKSKVSAGYSIGCVNISTLECDLTSLNEPIFEYGTYFGRVRAQSGSETSPWVESTSITMDKETVIGSPNIYLSSNRATIEVSIEDPVFALSSLRRVYSDITYNVTYWKDGQDEKAITISSIQQNRIVVDKLDPLTKYCFQVRINKQLNPTEPSTSVCESTGSEDIPWVGVVVTFVVLGIAAALVAVSVVYRRSIYHFLCPKDSLPEHFKEYLLEQPNSTIYKAMQNPQPPEIIADVIVVEGGPLEVTAPTCIKQPDITVDQR